MEELCMKCLNIDVTKDFVPVVRYGGTKWKSAGLCECMAREGHITESSELPSSLGLELELKMFLAPKRRNNNSN
jgi:hypothetical protein